MRKSLKWWDILLRSLYYVHKSIIHLYWRKRLKLDAELRSLTKLIELWADEHPEIFGRRTSTYMYMIYKKVGVLMKQIIRTPLRAERANEVGEALIEICGCAVLILHNISRKFPTSYFSILIANEKIRSADKVSSLQP